MEHYGWNQDGSEEIMSYLPLSHVAAQLVDCYMALAIGANVMFADKDALKGTLVDNLKEIRPTQFLGVPRVYEKIAEKMQEAAAKNSGLKKAVANWAKATATQHHTAVREGRIKAEDQPGWKYKLAKKVIFR